MSVRPVKIAAERRFPLRHPWDRFVFPFFILLIWVAVLMGFVPEVIDQVRTRSFNYPVLTHFHALVFISWLILLTIQTALVGSRNLRLHRKLGLASVFMIPLMVVLGLTASVSMFRRLYAPDFLPLTLSMRIADMFSFGGAAATGVILRNNPSAHKRLMLLATFCLAAAGFGRWWGDSMLARFGTGFLGRWSFDYLGVLILILLLAGYDLISRRRFNRPFLITASAVIAIQLTGVFVRNLPGWKPLAMTLIGR